MAMLPIFAKLDGRRGVIAGAGAVALDKVKALLPTGLALRVIAPRVHDEIHALAVAGELELNVRAFVETDLAGADLVIAATDVPEVNAAVYRAARARGIWCNSVDDIPHCDFFFGSLITRGPLQIAISTSGESPAVAQGLRREIDAQLPADLGPWLEQLGALRREVLAIHPAGEPRKQLLHQLAQREVCESPLCASRQLAQTPLDARGKVFLVGAGPGDPDLLSVKALRMIQAADTILHDDLVPPAILKLASTPAETVNVGKRCGAKSITQEEIHTLMIDAARAGRCVVRLKSGDPLIFGRAAEEMAALTAAQVPFEVVPGITAASAAAAAAGISLTSRHRASNVIFSTGHHAQSHNNAPLPEQEDATRVVYMPGRDLKLLALEWLSEGLPSDLPCAIVSRAGQPEQQVVHTILGRLAEADPVAPPSVLLAGWTLAERSAAVATVDAATESAS